MPEKIIIESTPTPQDRYYFEAFRQTNERLNRKPEPKVYKEPCMICGKPTEVPEDAWCCNGYECGCFGQPQGPIVCDELCHDALMAGCPGSQFEDRRVQANIPPWFDPETLLRNKIAFSLKSS